MINRAITRLELGRFVDVVSDLSDVLKLGRNDALVYFLRSRANKKLGRVEQANADHESAMERQPVTALGWGLRSAVTRKTDPRRAVLEMDHALRLNPISSKTLQNRAALLSLLGEHEAAIETLSKLIDLSPENASAYLSRGLLNAKQNRREAALADGRAGLRLSDAPKHHVQMARIFAQTSAIENEDSKHAADQVQKALAGEPKLARVMERDQELAVILDSPEARALLLAAKSLLVD